MFEMFMRWGKQNNILKSPLHREHTVEASRTYVQNGIHRHSLVQAHMTNFRWVVPVLMNSESSCWTYRCNELSRFGQPAESWCLKWNVKNHQGCFPFTFSPKADPPAPKYCWFECRHTACTVNSSLVQPSRISLQSCRWIFQVRHRKPKFRKNN